AEPLYRDALATFRTLHRESDAAATDAAVGLGRGLVRERRFSEADEVLIEAARCMEGDLASRSSYAECLRLIVSNCGAWDASEPDRGHADRAMEWKAKLAEVEGRSSPGPR